MRERILSGLESWDRLRAAPAWRIGMTLGSVVVAGLLLSLPLPAGLSEEGRRAAVVTGIMAVSWLGGVLPMAVTALIPIVAFPLLGVLTIQEATAPYADPLIFLMLGGFVLAHAMEEVGLHRRILAFLLGPQKVRENPRLTVLALMTTACVVSSFVSNTATMLMMLPLGLAVVGRLQGAVEEQSRARVRSASLLGLAYACSIGGVSTLVGTAPNAVFARMAGSMANREIGFGAWMMVGVPFVLLALPTAWWLVTAVALPLPSSVKETLPRPEKPDWAPG
ncbi:MAG TPA: SLC13 family permease, partial [Myxococcota bacterium]|nr:SLC13 family permease [Myxococcota bacterium]